MHFLLLAELMAQLFLAILQLLQLELYATGMLLLKLMCLVLSIPFFVLRINIVSSANDVFLA